MSVLPNDKRVEAILNFEIDDGDPSFRFVDRLARENRWTISYSEKVVREYKRFLAMMAILPHAVTPSEDVDQAWHLHLTFTESYWTRLCHETLGFPLHHCPTRGGTEEQIKFVDWYQRTLEAYHTLFEEAPPQDIWPSPEKRFKNVGEHRWINTAHHWIVDKTAFRRLMRSGWLSFALLPTALIGQQGFLDVDGPTFLLIYALLIAVGTATSLGIRYVFSPPEPKHVPTLYRPLEIACISGGQRRTLLTALAMLVHRGNLLVDEHDSEAVLSRGAPLPKNVTRLEQILFDYVDPEKKRSLRTTMQSGESEANAIADRLHDEGLLHAKSDDQQSHGLPGCIMTVIIMLGAFRLLVGFIHDKPIGYLLLLVVVACVAYGFSCRPRLRTSLGDRVYRACIERSEKVRERSAKELGQQTASELGIIVAIAGLGPLKGLHDPFVALYQAQTDSSTSGSCGGGGCGGGGDGGGGCGGGGCGGCGGGGG